MWAASGHTHAYSADIWIDHAIPLVPPWIVVYMAGYFMVFAPMFLIKYRDEMVWVAVHYFIMLSIAFAIFHFMPVYMGRTFAQDGDVFGGMTRFQQKTDTALNTFPSLHVALNLFAGLFVLSRSRRAGIFFVLMSVMIAISTLFVKQHLLVDVIGGEILGGGAFWTFCRFGRLSLKYEKPLLVAVGLLTAVFVGWQFERFMYIPAVLAKYLGAEFGGLFR